MYSTIEEPLYQQEYKIMSSYDADKLEQDVNSMLGNGWRVQGGVATAGGLFIQAVVRDVRAGVTREEIMSL